MIGNNIQAALIEVARRLMAKMTARVKQNNLPDIINQATSASQVSMSGNTYSISVRVDLGTALMAAAFEYGSGIWGESGEKYKISPKEGEALAFEYEVGKNIPSDIQGLAAKPIRYSKKTGKAIFKYVMHPGVRERPYIAPSVIENRVDAKQLLKRAFIESVIVRGTTKYEIRVM